ncbi:hypothetical protein BGZ67_007526 [Mortierella alpina]|nr:hypothetical protein BGZ67_007526 [Mortierella alpina]
MFRLALATLTMIPPARIQRKRGLEAQESEALSPAQKRRRTSTFTTTTEQLPRSRHRASPFIEARAWRRDQNRRQGERCLRKALSRHARALFQQKRAEMEGWLAATKAAEARVAKWRKEEEEDERLLQMEEAIQRAAHLLARQDREREAARAAEAKAKEKADEEASKAMREEAARMAAQRQAAKAAAEERAHQEAKMAAEAEAETKRIAEATAKTAAEADARRAKEDEEKEDRDKRMGDRQRAAREQQRQEGAGLREPASLPFVTTHKHAANRPTEEAKQRQLRGSALSSLSATRVNAKYRSAVPRSGGRTGPMPSPYCRPKRTSDPFSTGAPGHLPRGQVLAPLTTRSDACAAVKRHLFAGFQTTQRTQQQHGALPLQQGMSAHSAAVLSSLRQGGPSSAVTPRRSERLAQRSRKMAVEVASLTEAMRKL